MLLWHVVKGMNGHLKDKAARTRKKTMKLSMADHV